MKSHISGVISACALAIVSLSVQAVSVSGQGTWESTLEGRDLDGNAATFEAYYDTTLDITWLADANANGPMTWATANAWAAGLDVNGVTGWRLPTNTPINGSSYNTTVSANGTTDNGYTSTTTDGTNGGWRDASGNPVSEMGHMYYVTLGNLGFCNPSLSWCTEQTGWGLDNAGPFSNLQSSPYWSGSEFNSSSPWIFRFLNGNQNAGNPYASLYTWAVRSGDVSAVPVPAAVWLFGSGLIGLMGVARSRKASRC